MKSVSNGLYLQRYTMKDIKKDHPEDIKAGTLLRSLQLGRAGIPCDTQPDRQIREKQLISQLTCCTLHQKEEGKSKGKIAILRRSDGNTSQSKVVNLLLITDGEKSHYTAIKSLLRLLSRENRVKRDQQYYCLNCLNAFNSEVHEISTMVIASITMRSK